MRVSVLGLGSIGSRHATNLLALGHEVIGFDVDESRRATFDAKGGRATGCREKALERVAEGGALIVASPSSHHYKDVMDGLSGGSHLFVEKPFTHRIDKLDDALATAKRRGQVVFAAHNLRYHPAVEAARSVLDRGELGPILWARAICASYLPDWRPDQDYRDGYATDPVSGGVMFDVAHEFDLAAHLLGPYEIVASEARRSQCLDLRSEDIADVILKHQSEVLTSLHLDYVTRPPVRMTEIAGERGRIEIDMIERRFVNWTENGEIAKSENAATSIGDDYKTEMKHFLDCLNGEAVPRCDGEEALEIMRSIIQARAMAGLPFDEAELRCRGN